MGTDPSIQIIGVPGVEAPVGAMEHICPETHVGGTEQKGRASTSSARTVWGGMLFQSLDDVRDEFESIGELYANPFDERMKLLIKLGESLEPMPAALKTSATKVAGCASDVWVYALPTSTDDRLHFLADGTSAFTKGIVALILLAVQDRSAADILKADIEDALRPFKVGNQLTSIRTSGLLNMIQKIKDTAARLAA